MKVCIFAQYFTVSCQNSQKLERKGNYKGKKRKYIKEKKLDFKEEEPTKEEKENK